MHLLRRGHVGRMLVRTVKAVTWRRWMFNTVLPFTGKPVNR